MKTYLPVFYTEQMHPYYARQQTVALRGLIRTCQLQRYHLSNVLGSST